MANGHINNIDDSSPNQVPGSRHSTLRHNFFLFFFFNNFQIEKIPELNFRVCFAWNTVFRSMCIYLSALSNGNTLNIKADEIHKNRPIAIFTQLSLVRSCDWLIAPDSRLNTRMMLILYLFKRKFFSAICHISSASTFLCLLFSSVLFFFLRGGGGNFGCVFSVQHIIRTYVDGGRWYR